MKIEGVKAITVTVDILCDICGSSVIPNAYKGNADDVTEFSDYATLKASFGYGSKRDGEEFKLDFCERCFDLIVSKVEELKRIHDEK